MDVKIEYYKTKVILDTGSVTDLINKETFNNIQKTKKQKKIVKLIKSKK